MPLFDWSASSTSEIITPHFWVYWAVTIPLTLITMALVSVWIIFQSRRNEAIGEAARNTIGSDISCSKLSDPSLKGVDSSKLRNELWRDKPWKWIRGMRRVPSKTSQDLLLDCDSRKSRNGWWLKKLWKLVGGIGQEVFGLSGALKDDSSNSNSGSPSAGADAGSSILRNRRWGQKLWKWVGRIEQRVFCLSSAAQDYSSSSNSRSSFADEDTGSSILRNRWWGRKLWKWVRRIRQGVFGLSSASQDYSSSSTRSLADD
jgi:hypothetical protein